jgi:pantoate--beta-alanine ligase
MKVFTTIKEVADFKSYELNGSLGFVPTMGALHKGHLSLVNEAKKRCHHVAVSIFVNPTQFNDPSDLTNYPRTPEEDLSLLSTVLGNEDFVFLPTVKEIYPFEDKRVFHFGNIEQVMEGPNRPGHFNGVAQVVSTLFEIINPDFAFFGQKDFQQIAVIRDLVKQLYSPVKIISCPIIRETDGLAMSSRNRRLLPEHRENAGEIYKTLLQAAEIAPSKDIEKIKTLVTERINSIPGFNVEYFEIVESLTLTPVNSSKDILPGCQYFGCIALYAGKIRLIDNIELRLQ